MLRKISQRLRPFKNFLIIALIALALYQTGRLWFINITNRNFFYTYFMSIVQPVIQDGHSDIVCPYRIVSGSGDGVFMIRYSGLDSTDAKQYGDTVLAALLKSGEFTAARPADYAALYSRPVYVYEYAFSMTSDIFARAFGQRGSVLTSRGLSKFTGVVIQPPTQEDETVRVFFLDEDKAYEFILSKNNRQEPAARYTYTIPPVEKTYIYYVSAALENIEHTAPGLFIARWPANGPNYRPITFTNPYANIYGDKLLSHIQTRVSSFFDNPAALDARTGADGVYTISSINTNTVVRYYDRDILEYASYRAIDRSTAPNFMEDYSAALSFIHKDADIVNETYLAGYESTGDVNLFLFNYLINDMPLVMPAHWPSKAENGYPIEVTVDHGTVVRYKKLVYNFHIDESENLRGQLGYDGLMGSFYRVDGEEEAFTILRSQLGYRIESRQRLSLFWFVETEDEKLIKSIGS